MTTAKCPFSMIQAGGEASCSLAQQVVRRGGSEYDCTDAESHGECGQLLQALNAEALPALGYEDDLTMTPNSVYQRVMLGGLLGLRQEVDAQETEIHTSDIHAVVAQASSRHGSVEAIPLASLIPVMKDLKIKRRRKSSR